MRSAATRGIRIRGAAALLALLGLVLLATPAAAHVEIVPEVAEVGTPVELAIRVPSEANVPVVRVEVTFPEGLEVFAFESTPGWRRRVLFTGDGRVRGVIYVDGRINAQEFADLAVLATPTSEGVKVFRALQTYEGGDVQRWVVPPGPNGEPAEEGAEPGKPGAAPLLTVRAAGAGAPSAGEGTPTPVAADSGDEDDSSGAGIWLGLIAIAVSALAALGVGLLWSTRPARLPDDPPEEG